MVNDKTLEIAIKYSYNADNMFAVNRSEIENAVLAINKANEEKKSFKGYIALHRKFLDSKGAGPDHIESQLHLVADITSYFKINM